MNPLWLLVGIQIGDRIKWNREFLAKAGTMIGKKVYWAIDSERQRWKLLDATHRDLENLPVTDERG